MPTITFKAKAVPFANTDDTDRHYRVKVPRLTRRHCDMHAFRTSREFGAYANSDLFEGILDRSVRQHIVTGGEWIRTDRPPPGVTVETTGFLTRVTITVPLPTSKAPTSAQ